MRGTIQSEKACYEVAIPSEVKPTMHQEDEKQAEERRERLTGRKGEQAANQYAFNRRKSVEESLLRSHHSVSSETDTASGRERTSTRKRESQSEQ